MLCLLDKLCASLLQGFLCKKATDSRAVVQVLCLLDERALCPIAADLSF